MLLMYNHADSYTVEQIQDHTQMKMVISFASILYSIFFYRLLSQCGAIGMNCLRYQVHIFMNVLLWGRGVYGRMLDVYVPECSRFNATKGIQLVLIYA